MRLRTCAVGVLKVPIDEYIKLPNTPQFKIFGTGFLVGPQTILTNRHVAVSLMTYVENKSIPKDRRYVAFIRPEGEGVANTHHAICLIGMITEPAFFDVAMISFNAAPEDPIRSLSPVNIPAKFSHEVGDAVAIYGYAAGENLLKREYGKVEALYRFGPILQHGFISGISPFEHAPLVDRILFDVRTSKGMSGSPVFDPVTGNVIAIHDAGVGETVAFGIPLSSDMISSLLKIRLKARLGDHGISEVPWVVRDGQGSAT